LFAHQFNNAYKRFFRKSTLLLINTQLIFCGCLYYNIWTLTVVKVDTEKSTFCPCLCWRICEKKQLLLETFLVVNSKRMKTSLNNIVLVIYITSGIDLAVSEHLTLTETNKKRDI